MTLEQLKTDMEQLAGEWNGDLPGLAEERADTALDILEKIKDIEASLEYLNEIN